MITAVVASLAEPHDNSEYELFSNYSQNPTTENFQKAFNHYSSQDTETARILLAYLHFMELDANLEFMQSSIDSLSTKTQFSFANLLLDLKRYDQAIEVYDRLNSGNPNWACPWRHKGEALWKLGKLDQAQTALEKSIEVRKNHYDAYVMLAEVLYDAGKTSQALATLESGLQYRSENPEYSEDNEFERHVQELHNKLKAELKK